MSFDFTTSDGRVFHLDTEGGEVHCAEVAPRVAVFAGIVGRNGVKPDTWYTLEGGKLAEVDAE